MLLGDYVVNCKQGGKVSLFIRYLAVVNSNNSFIPHVSSKRRIRESNNSSQAVKKDFEISNVVTHYLNPCGYCFIIAK